MAMQIPERFPFGVTFISTYIPRKCGIATFTKDLTKNMNILNPLNPCRIVAIVDSEKEPVEYPWEVSLQVEKNKKAAYKSAAIRINASSSKFVSLQHEYGIFGGRDGEYILELLKNLKKPVVTTFHTVLKTPSSNQRRILIEIAKKSHFCIVMAKEAAKRMHELYKIPEKKILIIPHGVPNVPFSPAYMYKESLGFKKDDFLIGTINLLSANKGLEYIIQALPTIKEKIPRVKYLMVGQTHPLVKLEEGEMYRQKLLALAKKLGVLEQIVEVNTYLTLEQLISYLQAMDIYVTPYLDMSQTASGTLAYAVGAGKCCIATPYIYAKEILSHRRGIIVSKKNAKAISKAVIHMYLHPNRKEEIERNAYAYGRMMIWSRVALEYLYVFHHLQRPLILRRLLF